MQRYAVVTTIHQLFTLSPIWPTTDMSAATQHTFTYDTYDSGTKDFNHLPSVFFVFGYSLARSHIHCCVTTCVNLFSSACVCMLKLRSTEFTSTDRLLLCGIEISTCAALYLCKYQILFTDTQNLLITIFDNRMLCPLVSEQQSVCVCQLSSCRISIGF